jgi:hypothetical protein
VPARGVPVYLLVAAHKDAVQLYLANKTGERIPPVAETRTDADGSFAIAVPRAGQTYDLRVVPDAFPELTHASIQVPAGEWYDCRDLQLVPGVVVQGRVVEATTHQPIAGAQVYLSSPNQSIRLQATPGRERGLAAATDGGGFFRFANAPRESLIELAAESPAHALTTSPNLKIETDAVNEFTLELPRGQPIAGVVVDPAGRPVGGANVDVTAMSTKTPFHDHVHSAPDGAFALPMLRPGPYRLQATAPGFEDGGAQLVFSGRTDVKLVLDRRSAVRLRVLSARGQPVRTYTVALRRHFPNQPGSIGKVIEFHDVRVTPADLDGGWAQIRSVPSGEFVFQVTDADHAKTLSPPFRTGPDLPAPAVEVTLTAGATITGTVVDDRGQPVAGADVASDMNGAAAGPGSFLDIFGPFLPDKHTTRATRTDAAGRFTLTKLSFAEYMVRAAHPDFCTGTATDVTLTTSGQTVDVGAIALARGTVIEGLCTVGGQPHGQINVMIGPPDGAPPAVDAKGRQQPFFSAAALSGADGRYRLLQRVPPGTYKIHAYRQAGSNDIFARFGDSRLTQRPLQVTAGQDRSVQNFDLPAR